MDVGWGIHVQVKKLKKNQEALLRRGGKKGSSSFSLCFPEDGEVWTKPSYVLPEEELDWVEAEDTGERDVSAETWRKQGWWCPRGGWRTDRQLGKSGFQWLKVSHWSKGVDPLLRVKNMVLKAEFTYICFLNTRKAVNDLIFSRVMFFSHLKGENVLDGLGAWG